ncbi:MAG: hypothetical protein JWM80_2289 [Cyanobacteria bacterium RYN_339]|nr:hypothetical protein [Cyanobacteria bacterium RYN_339]
MTATLTLAKPEAASLLQHQLGEGQRFLAQAVANAVDFARVNQERSAWSLRNRQILFRVFEDNSGITGYRGLDPISTSASLPLRVEHFRQEVRAQLACLQEVLKKVG